MILHGYAEWGADCVNRFNGMFAFALWDKNKQELLLARDHLGVKPLYYTVAQNRLLFGSEIKALLQDSGLYARGGPQIAGILFTLRFIPSPDTLFRGINKLPPGHRMMVSSRGMQVERYWKWRPPRCRAGAKRIKHRYQERLKTRSGCK